MQPDYQERVQESIDAGRSRAVLTATVAGESARCESCNDWVGFKAQQHLGRVLCNVYVEQRWVDLKTYHPDCYIAEGAPHGTLLEGDIRGISRTTASKIIAATIPAPAA